jgi:hypothetical protein
MKSRTEKIQEKLKSCEYEEGNKRLNLLGLYKDNSSTIVDIAEIMWVNPMTWTVALRFETGHVHIIQNNGLEGYESIILMEDYGEVDELLQTIQNWKSRIMVDKRYYRPLIEDERQDMY